jgi:hypothetical protein
LVNRFSTALSRGLSTIPSKNFFWNLVNLFAASQASPATGDRASKASNRGLTSDQERAHGAAGAVPWKGEPNDLLGLAVATSVCRSQRSHRVKECGDLAPAGDGFCAVSAVPEGVPIALGRARRQAAVQPAPAVRHRGRPAPAPSPRPRSTSAAEVHRRSALHGVDPQVSGQPLPPGPRSCRRQLDRRNARGRAPPSPFAGPCRDAGSRASSSTVYVRESLLAWFRFSLRPSDVCSGSIARR